MYDNEKQFRTVCEELLAPTGVQINGRNPWDIQVHHPRFFRRVLAQGSLGLGESYMDGDWDCQSIDQLVNRLLKAKLDKKVYPKLKLWWSIFMYRIYNFQSKARAFQVGERHYDLGNHFYQKMLDSRMIYSCAYWKTATTLEQAQIDKLDLICRKLQLKPGMKLLDIGCGWGGLMKFASENYGVSCVGLTVSKEQALWAQDLTRHLPIDIQLIDYRNFNPQEKFERVVSVGMFEHVGHKNYPVFFQAARRSIQEDGLFLLHTIGRNCSTGPPTDPWIIKYIFPNGEIPGVGDIALTSEGNFVMEDLHNFGAYYDLTLMHWHDNFENHWHEFSRQFDQRFYRMWKYYLLTCAGAFRARDLELWQIVLSPSGVDGGYHRVS